MAEEDDEELLEAESLLFGESLATGVSAADKAAVAEVGGEEAEGLGFFLAFAVLAAAMVTVSAEVVSAAASTVEHGRVESVGENASTTVVEETVDGVLMSDELVRVLSSARFITGSARDSTRVSPYVPAGNWISPISSRGEPDARGVEMSSLTVSVNVVGALLQMKKQ